jgi:hypothetical protein
MQNMVSNRTPYAPVYVHMCTVLIHTGKRGRVESEKGKGANRKEYRSQSRVENTNMTECTQGILSNSEKHLPQSPFTDTFL